MENQRKFLEDHDIKIQEIENVINKIMKDKRRQEEDQIDTTGEKNQRMKLVSRALSFPGAKGKLIFSCLVSVNYQTMTFFDKARHTLIATLHHLTTMLSGDKSPICFSLAFLKFVYLLSPARRF